MLNDYLIVNKEVLPDVFEKVVQVKKMMEQGDEIQVSDAVKKVGLSRSTYYKYKDHVFATSDNIKERKAVVSFMLSHQKGLLSEVLFLITSLHCNIITINQNIPIHEKANVTMSIDISEMEMSPTDFVNKLAELKGVSKVVLLALE